MPTNNNRLITYYIYEITFNLDGRTYIGQRQCPKAKLKISQGMKNN